MNPPPDIQVRDLTLAEAPAAAAVLGRGMRDNPLHRRVLGEDPERRERALTGVFRAFLRLEVARKGRVLGAFQDGRLVGVCGMMRPGYCQLGPAEKLTLLPGLLGSCGWSGTARLLAWFAVWSRHDSPQPHWHPGPVAIERELQGRGIGSPLLRRFCESVDADRCAAWLETDKEINVAFYRKFGFEAVAESPVLGLPNWFMKRSCAS